MQSKRLISQARTITAGQQFAGTEFSIGPADPNNALRLLEVNLRMGTESKTWRIEKRKTDGTVIVLLQQSTDPTGVPAANTAEGVVMRGDDVEVLLLAGEQIQIKTTGATAAMRAQIYLEELTFR